MNDRVAVFVDGENLGASHAGTIAELEAKQGEIVLARVYGDVGRLDGWQESRRYTLVHAGRGKNATDILPALDAFALAGRFDTCILASSDRDFAHLAVKLRERSIRVVGAGPAASPGFVARCSAFAHLPACAGPPKPCAARAPRRDALDDRLHEVIALHGAGGAIRITALNPIMRRDHALRISERPEKTWRRIGRNSTRSIRRGPGRGSASGRWTARPEARRQASADHPPQARLPARLRLRTARDSGGTACKARSSRKT